MKKHSPDDGKDTDSLSEIQRYESLHRAAEAHMARVTETYNTHASQFVSLVKTAGWLAAALATIGTAFIFGAVWEKESQIERTVETEINIFTNQVMQSSLSKVQEYVAGQSVEAKIQTAVNGRVDQLDDILRASLGESDAFFRVLALEGNGTNASQALLSKTVAEVIASARLETMTAFAHSTDTNFVWKILTLRTNINDIQTPLGQLASGQPFSLIDTNVFWNRFSSGTNGSVLGTFRSQGETEPTSRSNDTNHFLTTVNFDFSSKDIETYRNLFWKFPLPDFDCAVLAKLYQSSVPRRDEYTFYYEILSAPGNVKTQEMVCYIVGMESGNGWDIIQRDECLRWLRIQLLK